MGIQEDIRQKLQEIGDAFEACAAGSGYEPPEPPDTDPEHYQSDTALGRIVDPDGNTVCGVGANVGVGIPGIAGPYVFAAAPPGSMPGAGEPDDPVTHPAGTDSIGRWRYANTHTYWDPAQGAAVTIPNLAPEMRQMCWQHLRLTMALEGDNGNPSITQNAHGAADAAVELATQEGFISLVTVFSGGDRTLGQITELKLRQWWDAFFARMTSAHGGINQHPKIWLQPHNEPFPLANQARWEQFSTFYYNFFRVTHGAKNMVVMGADRYSQDLTPAAAGSYDAWFSGKVSTALDIHFYGAFTDTMFGSYPQGGPLTLGPNAGVATDAESMAQHLSLVQQMQARNIPLYGGEVGTTWPDYRAGTGPLPQDIDWERQGLEFILAHSGNATNDLEHCFPALWWHATGDTSFNLKYSLGDFVYPDSVAAVAPNWLPEENVKHKFWRILQGDPGPIDPNSGNQVPADWSPSGLKWYNHGQNNC